MLAKVAGPVHIDMMERKFEYTVGDVLQHAIVHPMYLPLFSQEALMQLQQLPSGMSTVAVGSEDAEDAMLL